MTVDLKDPQPVPAVVLIPEARQHQKRRYAWTGIVAGLAALLVAALLAGGVVLFSGSPAPRGSQAPGAPAAALVASSPHSFVYFRPVLCTVPAYAPAPSASASSTRLACSPTSTQSVANLNVTPDPPAGGPSGFSANNVPPDGALAGVPSTPRADDRVGATVLVPEVPGTNIGVGATRALLGPAELTNASVGWAQAEKNRTGQWVVDYRMAGSGAAQRWDEVAQRNFHEVLAVDFDGTIVSAPIIQPTQSTFSSFDGRGEISGSLTRSEALALATALHRHGH